jgi:hypothetical protein
MEELVWELFFIWEEWLLYAFCGFCGRKGIGVLLRISNYPCLDYSAKIVCPKNFVRMLSCFGTK